MALSDVQPSTWEVRAGQAHIGGVAVSAMAEEFGTPLYIMDEHHIRSRLRQYREAFGEETVLAFAAKSFICPAMAQIVEEEGWHCDVVSLGEATTALAGGVPARRLIYHGNYKTPEELRFIAEKGVGLCVVDHLEEIAQVADHADAAGRPVDVLLRLAVGVRANTHPKVRTAGPDAHFGLSWEDASEAVALATACQGRVRLKGVHTHIGSQLFDLIDYTAAAHELTSFVADHRDAFPDRVDIDLGGGLGVPYNREDAVISIASHGEALLAGIAAAAERDDISDYRLIIEPGRSISANAGVSVYRIGVRKRAAVGAPFLAVDGGMSDNPRPTLYGAQYEALLAEHADKPHDALFRVVGRHCEAGDVLVPGARLPEDAGAGDLLVILGTGAYTYTMSSRYNLLPRPPVIFANSGEAWVAVAGETLSDVVVES